MWRGSRERGREKEIENIKDNMFNCCVFVGLFAEAQAQGSKHVWQMLYHTTEIYFKPTLLSYFSSIVT